MLFKKLKLFLRDYFTLTSRERKGALVLACVIFIQILILIYLHYLPDPGKVVIVKYQMQLAAFDKKIANQQLKPIHTFDSGKHSLLQPDKLVAFDPNTISDQQWADLGLTAKQTAVIRNYLNKGGRFRQKEDLSKMYCITPAMYQKLDSFIEINTPAPVPEFKRVQKQKNEIEILDLNRADTLMLVKLPMIGEGRARLIYRYREKLGGFSIPEQLLEVFTIDSSVYQAILPFCKIDEGNIRKLNINGDSLYHPYISKQAARAIIAYRKQHGNYYDINSLRKVAVIDEQMLRKLVPYLAFE